ncbi:Hypothetical_protein [Hexamita inflata]|uniref:Hypothetical_protein n=1 Tax=Hexamita inflata TaxID=28002 RepID=A0AA86RQP9_9EUKA|nr:Hypothetical protein HINF_LOCUS66596 [Hexamita inflata]
MSCKDGLMFTDKLKCAQTCEATYTSIKISPQYCCDATTSINFDVIQLQQFKGYMTMCLGGLQNQQDCINTCIYPYTCVIPIAQYCCSNDISLDTENNTQQNLNLNTMQIAVGCGVGGFILLLAIIIITYYVRHLKKQKQSIITQNSQNIFTQVQQQEQIDTVINTSKNISNNTISILFDQPVIQTVQFNQSCSQEGLQIEWQPVM